MYAEWFKLEPVFEIGSLNSQGYLLIGLFTANFQMMVKYRGPFLPVTSPALASNDLTLDQSMTSIEILPEPALVT